VRAGAKQRTAVALLDEPAYSDHGETLVEMLEAAGAQSPRVLPTGAALPEADIVLVPLRAGDAALPRDPVVGSQVWAIDVERLAAVRDERIVESVETLIRVVMPEALGANGTPPDEAVAVRLA